MTTLVKFHPRRIAALAAAGCSLLLLGCQNDNSSTLPPVLGFTIIGQANGEYREQTVNGPDLTAAPGVEGPFPNSFRQLSLKSGWAQVQFRYKVRWYSGVKKMMLETDWLPDGATAPMAGASGHICAIAIELRGPSAEKYQLKYQTTRSKLGVGESLPPTPESMPGEWSGIGDLNPAIHFISRITVGVELRKP